MYIKERNHVGNNGNFSVNCFNLDQLSIDVIVCQNFVELLYSAGRQRGCCFGILCLSVSVAPVDINFHPALSVV